MTPSWRGDVANAELDALHADAFGTPSGADWRALLERHSLGWTSARDGDRLVGFANVLWDGRTHAWLQDVMVAGSARRTGVGRALVGAAVAEARAAGCAWLHADYAAEHAPFYAACGFAPTAAGLVSLL
jgi:GNAT superfamily N-acetyltransferase